MCRKLPCGRRLTRGQGRNDTWLAAAKAELGGQEQDIFPKLGTKTVRRISFPPPCRGGGTNRVRSGGGGRAADGGRWRRATFSCPSCPSCPAPWRSTQAIWQLRFSFSWPSAKKEKIWAFGPQLGCPQARLERRKTETEPGQSFAYHGKLPAGAPRVAVGDGAVFEVSLEEDA